MEEEQVLLDKNEIDLNLNLNMIDYKKDIEQDETFNLQLSV